MMNTSYFTYIELNALCLCYIVETFNLKNMYNSNSNSQSFIKLTADELKKLVPRQRVAQKAYVSPVYQCANGIKMTCHTDCYGNWEPVLGTDGVDGFRCDDLITWCDGLTEYDPAYKCEPDGSGTDGSGTFFDLGYDASAEDTKLL